jgi:hypothetical protein
MSVNVWSVPSLLVTVMVSATLTLSGTGENEKFLMLTDAPPADVVGGAADVAAPPVPVDGALRWPPSAVRPCPYRSCCNPPGRRPRRQRQGPTEGGPTLDACSIESTVEAAGKISMADDHPLPTSRSSTGGVHP